MPLRRVTNWIRRPLQQPTRGSSMVEFVALVVIIFVPLTYAVLAFFAIQRSTFAATEAARQAGRAYAMAPDSASGAERASYAAALSVQAHAVNVEDVQTWAAPANATCEDPAQQYTPELSTAEVFVVCVRVVIRVPLIPDFITANTATGRFVVSMDSFR